MSMQEVLNDLLEIQNGYNHPNTITGNPHNDLGRSLRPKPLNPPIAKPLASEHIYHSSPSPSSFNKDYTPPKPGTLDGAGKVLGITFLGILGLGMLGNLLETFGLKGFVTFGIWISIVALPFWLFYRWSERFLKNRVGRSLFSGALTVSMLLALAITIQALS